MRLIKEYPWCKKHNIETIVVDIRHNHYFIIWNSFKIKRIKQMLDVLKTISEYYKSQHTIVFQICVWKIHNFLYNIKCRNIGDSCVFSEEMTLKQQIKLLITSLFNF